MLGDGSGHVLENLPLGDGGQLRHGLAVLVGAAQFSNL